jgi:hypothetical protein
MDSVMDKPINKDSLLGREFGFLTVESCAGKRPGLGGLFWNCKCLCGEDRIVSTSNLISGESKSCGCRKRRRGKQNPRWSGYGDIGLEFFNSIKTSSRFRGRPIKFDLTIEQAWELFIKQDGRCAISGVAISIDPGLTTRTASLDRIDSRKDYVIDNVQWVHKDVNRMKSNFPQEVFLKWVEEIFVFQNGQHN